MKTFYWYSGGVVALMVLVIVAVTLYTFYFAPKSPGNDAGLVTFVALAGPAVALWFIAVGWVVAIFWRKFSLKDPELSPVTFYVALVVCLIVLKSPFDAYKTFFPKVTQTTTGSQDK